MKELHPGDRVSWRGLNKDYTGTVERFDERTGWLVRLDGSEKYIIISKPKHNDKK